MTMGALDKIRSWRSRWQPVSAVLHAPPHAPGDARAIDAGVSALAQWAALHPGARLELGLSSRWLLCAATPQAEDAASAVTAACQQWSHYLGLDEVSLADGWACLPVVGPHAKMVCAAPRALVEGLSEVAAQHRVRLVAMLPWWAFSLQSRLALDDASAEVEGPLRWAWVEPGWSLNIEARRAPQPGSGWCLERAWMACEGETGAGVMDVVAELPMPSCDTAAGADDAARTLLWFAPEASALLKGVRP